METEQQDPVIEIQDLAKTYSVGFWGRKSHVLKGVNLKVFANETFGLLGPNGAGKTTTLKILTGLVKPSKGTVHIWGKPPSHVRSRYQIGYLPEHPTVYVYLTGQEFLDLCGRFFNIPRVTLQARIRELLDKVGLSKIASQKRIGTYSKGMLQRLGFAQALINDPSLLLLDEPMSGLDPIGRHDVKELILQLKAESKTILFNSHILSDVEAICDRVGILIDGVIVKQGNIDEWVAPLDNMYQLTVKGLNSVGKNNLKRLSLRLIERQEGHVEVTFNNFDTALKAVAVAKQSGGRMLELKSHRDSLEDLFIQLVQEHKKESKEVQ